MAINAIPGMGDYAWFAAHILQGRCRRMTPYTCLVVAIDGETVFGMTGVTVYSRPYAALPWEP